jgi:hypothetical protein
MHTTFKYYIKTSKFDKMVNEEDIKNALSALDAQLILNYRQIGLKFAIDYTMLMRRHKGICTSKVKATSIYYKLLTNTQEELLIN